MLYNELFRAVEEQDTTMIARLIRQGISPDTIDAHGEPVLLIAARLAKPDSVSALLKSGADPRARGPLGQCLLHHLASYPANLKLVGRALDEWELDIDAPDSQGRTPLMSAVLRGCVSGARLLIDLGANPLKRDRDGSTVVYHFVAGIYGFKPGEPHGEQLALLRDLLDLGIEPDAAGPRGYTALSIAGERGLIDVVEVLLEAGASVKMAPPMINPVTAAALAGQGEIAELLVRRGGSIDWFAAVALGRTDLVGEALAAEPELKDAREPRSGSCSLAIAIRHGHEDVAARLLEAGADPNGYAYQGRCLHEAVASLPSPELVKRLIRAGANINAGDGDWNTPLNFAARDDRMDIARLLLEEGADPNIATERGSTPLVFATSDDMRELIRAYGGH
ncbi:MAG: ankyrin repeat domain-containing protein [Xanthomonadales bacterium]|nr:ankyrin repeat domain-containing protein [Xanthomonadales bacterium]